jgi:hypothetical protein
MYIGATSTMGSVGSLGSYRKFVLAFGPRTTYNTKRIEIHKSLNINKKMHMYIGNL